MSLKNYEQKTPVPTNIENFQQVKDILGQELKNVLDLLKDVVKDVTNKRNEKNEDQQ